MLPRLPLSPEQFSLPAVWISLCFVFPPFKSFLLSSLYMISTKLEKMKIFLKNISHLQKIKLMGKSENGVGFLFPCEKFFFFFLTFIILVHFWRWHRPLSEKAMAPHSSTLAWKIPWTQEPGGRQSMGSLGIRYDWATSLSLFTFLHWRRKWQPTPVFLPGESQGWGSLVGCRLWGHTELDTTEAT